MKGSRFSKRLEAIPPSKLKVDFALTKKEGVISLSIGEPDFETPFEIEQAGIASIQNGYTFYSDGAGLPQLRKSISKYLDRHYGLSYNPSDEILVTVGASEAIDIALRTLLNEGDEVLLPVPSYISYAPLIELAGGKVVEVPLHEDKAFRLQPQDLENAIMPLTKLLILNYPHNPTGAIMEPQDLAAIAQIAVKHDLLVITDEIYADLTYGKKPCSIASFPGMKERTLYISGFSKAFAMTGWRLGYVCGPTDILQRLKKIHNFTLLAAPTISQFAAVDAMEHEEEETLKMRDAYNARRLFLIETFKSMGLSCFTPEGAFYVFPNIAGRGLSSDAFVSQLFSEEKLLVIPGTAFGEKGEGFIRISYAYSLDILKEAMKRLAHFLKAHPKVS
jgi:aminotransferase